MSAGGYKKGDPGESSAELTLPDEIRRVPAGSRITLGFDGPPLTLPGEADDGSALTLDTAELHAPPPAEESPTSSSSPLELDLEDLAQPEPADACRRDHRRRSTPPPGTGAFAHATAATLRAPRSSADGALPHLASGHELGGAGPALPFGDGGALGLVERSRPSQPDLDLASEMAERYALGDFTGALRAAELLLGRDDAHPEAVRYAQSSRERLAQLYESRLGDMAQIPQVKVPPTEIRWLGLDHRAGFLLSRVDGVGTVEQLIDVSGMPRLEALKTLVELLDAGAVELQ